MPLWPYDCKCGNHQGALDLYEAALCSFAARSEMPEN